MLFSRINSVKEKLMRFVIIALCTLMLTLVAVAETEASYQVGDPIADFTLNDAYGTPVSLSDFQGTVILLNFWRTG
jgi:cytochrome oxidase Cu insertion factor (SCO1/SenC/PrrC family)